MSEKRKKCVGNCIDCGKEICCGNIRGDIFCRECAMLRNIKSYIDMANGKDV